MGDKSLEPSHKKYKCDVAVAILRCQDGGDEQSVCGRLSVALKGTLHQPAGHI